MSTQSRWSAYSAEYKLPLPDEKQLAEELNGTRRMLEARRRGENKGERDEVA
ncbi:MAG: hypothetical protein ACE5HO_06195 [bacterium]